MLRPLHYPLHSLLSSTISAEISAPIRLCKPTTTQLWLIANGGPWELVDDLVTYNKQVYVPATATLVPAILKLAHGTGHEGVQKTLHRLRANFHVPNAHSLVQEFVRACDMST